MTDVVCQDVCVAIPTYNEAGTIRDLIDSLEGLRDVLRVRIVVVDDSSRDGTIGIVEE